MRDVVLQNKSTWPEGKFFIIKNNIYIPRNSLKWKCLWFYLILWSMYIPDQGCYFTLHPMGCKVTYLSPMRYVLALCDNKYRNVLIHGGGVQGDQSMS